MGDRLLLRGSVSGQGREARNEVIHTLRGMVWEVIPESVHQQLPIKDSSDKVLYEGDIVNVLCNDGSNENCLVGFDTERFGWGLMTAHYYTSLKHGYFKEESYNNAFLQNCLTHDTVVRIIGNIYDNEQLLIVQ